MYRILLVDAEPASRSMLQAMLEGSGYEVETAASGQKALASTERRVPHLAIVDLDIPDLDGCVVTRTLHSSLRVPVIVLCAAGNLEQKLRAFEYEADDCLCRPFHPHELLARVGAVLRGVALHHPCVTVGELEINLPARNASVGSRRLQLTPMEFQILAKLAARSGEAVTYEDLIDAFAPAQGISALRVHAHSIRSELERTGARDLQIRTVRGIGYLLENSAPKRQPA